MKHLVRKITSLLRNGVTCCRVADYNYYLATQLSRDLRVFKKNVVGYPVRLKSLDEWHQILDKIIETFDLLQDDDSLTSEEEAKRMQEGLDLFAKHYRDLWI